MANLAIGLRMPWALRVAPVAGYEIIDTRIFNHRDANEEDRADCRLI